MPVAVKTGRRAKMFHILIGVLFFSGVKLAPVWPTLDSFFPPVDQGEYGNKFEGDMILTTSQRNGLIGKSKRWPNNTVVYTINEHDFDPEKVEKIKAALDDIAAHSCIKFREKQNKDKHAVKIKGDKSGCFSSVGYVKGEEGGESQVLNLSQGCFHHGTIVHEMLHTLGFYHMQSTYNRDDYVKILWENISPGTEHNFAKYKNDTVTDFGVKYDYRSVMHYSEKAFSKNGKNTIVPQKENVTIGQRDGLSKSDILKLNKMYCQ